MAPGTELERAMHMTKREHEWEKKGEEGGTGAHQDREEGVDVAPEEAEDPLLLDGRDEDAREHAEREDQVGYRHAEHQPATSVVTTLARYLR